MSDTVELYCQAGDHQWHRAKQRGKRPLSCPEHAAKPSKSNHAERTAVRLEQRQAALEAEQDELYPFLNDEELRQVTYIDARTTTGTTAYGSAMDDDDVGMLRSRRSRLLEQAIKRRKSASTRQKIVAALA